MNTSVKHDLRSNKKHLSSTDICLMLVLVTAMVFIGMSVAGNIGMNKSTNPIFVTLTDVGLVGIASVFVFTIVAAFILKPPKP